MSLYTYIKDYEIKSYQKTTDIDINELYELAKERHGNLLIKETVWTTTRLFRKPKIQKTYSLYFNIENKAESKENRINECRCVNGIGIDRVSIISYLAGMIDATDNLKLDNDK